MDCPYCLSIARHPTAQEDLAWLSNVLLLRLSARLQRAHCYPFQLFGVSTDIVLLVVVYRLSYKLSLRDVAEMFLERGFAFTHEAVRDWEARFAPLIAAIREILGSDVVHRTNHYLNNRLKQDHRGIKQRYYPMRGFGNFTSASRFCRTFDEVRQFSRIRSIMKQIVSLVQHREMFRQRLEALKALVLMA